MSKFEAYCGQCKQIVEADPVAEEVIKGMKDAREMVRYVLKRHHELVNHNDRRLNYVRK